MTNNSIDYRYCISGNAPVLYPTEICYSALYYTQEESLPIPKCYPYRGEWGEILSTEILSREDYPMPIRLVIAWLSIVEQQFYQLEVELPANRLQTIWNYYFPETFSHIVVGMAPFGGVALWCVGEDKSVLVKWMQAKPYKVNFKEFKSGDQYISLEHYCSRYLESNRQAKNNIERYGQPPRDLYDKYMQQFTYRYLTLFEHWDEDKGEWQKYDEEEILPEFEYIEEALFDGTHDKLHDGGLMNYHEAGKPKTLAVKWHVKKSDFTAYYWFEDEEICRIYDRFYGAHPNTKTDFMIRIDSEKNKYELALYRYGLKEPLVISESAYQLIVFKDKFECFRSENYDQPTGAWIW